MLVCFKREKNPLLEGTIVISRHENSKFADTIAEVVLKKE
jgi:hypothetical protein